MSNRLVQSLVPQPNPVSLRNQTSPEPRLVISPEQVRRLRDRREGLRSQLAEATRQRDALTAQLRPGPTGPGLSPALSGGVEARVQLLDTRILQLERDQSATESQLRAVDPAVLPRVAEIATAVDAVAIEVERIGEGQRFVTQLLVEERITQVPKVSAAIPEADQPH